MSLKSLEEHNSQAIWQQAIAPKPNGIACPDCGSELLDSNPMVVLSSYPAQKSIHCPKCNYKGYRIA